MTREDIPFTDERIEAIIRERAPGISRMFHTTGDLVHALAVQVQMARRNGTEAYNEAMAIMVGLRDRLDAAEKVCTAAVRWSDYKIADRDFDGFVREWEQDRTARLTGRARRLPELTQEQVEKLN